MIQRVKLTRLIDMPVRHPDGRELGNIEEIILDPVHGMAEQATIRLSKDQNLRVLVPWSQLRLTEAQQCFELEIGPQTLKAVATRRGS